MNINKIIESSDIILEVVDSRAIEHTRNKKIEKKILDKGKYLIIVGTKADLVPEHYLKEYQKKTNLPFVYVSYTQRKGAQSVKNKIYILAKKLKKDKVFVGVIGYPNIGKSSLINLLTRSQKTTHSPIPGFTKNIKWIRLKKGIILTDTAGIIPKGESFCVLKSNVDPDKQESYDYAIKLIEHMKKTWNNFKDVFGINIENKNPEEVIKELAQKRNYLLSKGELDLEKAAKEIIRKWNKGDLGAFIH